MRQRSERRSASLMAPARTASSSSGSAAASATERTRATLTFWRAASCAIVVPGGLAARELRLRHAERGGRRGQHDEAHAPEAPLPGGAACRRRVVLRLPVLCHDLHDARLRKSKPQTLTGAQL